MKIHLLAPAPSARRVTIFLQEIDLQIEQVNVDIRGGENLTAAFLDKSANGLIPLLELDNGDYIGESVAICRYLEAVKAPRSSLFGNTPLEQGKVEMWHRIVELQGMVPAFQAFRNISGVYSDRENIVPSWGEESKARLIDFLPKLDRQLSNHAYIAGSDFSIVDISAFVLISFIEKLEIQIPSELTNLSRWFSLVKERPSVQA